MYVTRGTCYSVWRTIWYVWYAYQTVIPSTKCRINAVVSPDDEHIVSRNRQRKEINMLRKIVHQVGFIYRTI